MAMDCVDYIKVGLFYFFTNFDLWTAGSMHEIMMHCGTLRNMFYLLLSPRFCS